MPQCPRCKGDMPLLSKICPVCQYVIEGDDSAPKAEELVNTLERILLDIKNLPKPSFLDSLRSLLYIVIPVLTLYFVVLALISGAGFFWIIGGAGGIMSLYSTIQRIIQCFKPSAKMFDVLKNQYEYNERIARRNFGKNPEVSRLINDISAEISEVEAQHYAAKRHNLYLWVITGIAFLVLATGGVVTTTLVADKNTEQPITAWQQKIEDYKNSENNTEFGDNSARIVVLEDILANKEYAAAEDFFFTYCQGKVGDVDCAKVIIRAYMANSQTDKAMGFVNRVVLRYTTDAVKLKKMLNDYGTIQ